ncbi:MAG TPA: NADH:flavin oxidoreductase/NADH oxidase [Albitalea sp.]|nr:NADH:flavin oxidoreductase/NADH oxidase [Albitalea sp.]
MSRLFSPFRVGGLTLRNRIVVSPMCQYSADQGRATDWHLLHLGQLALSGAALLFTEAAAVEPAGRISPQDLGLWSDDTQAALARVVQTVRRHSGIALGIQLAHAGRKASTRAPWLGGQQIPAAEGGWQTVAPSALAHAPGEHAPQALDADGLARVRRAFADAAVRAERLGFELIELHAAHGYLLHQFLSPIANRRTDDYGGTLAARMRFPLEVFDAVRAAVSPAVAVGMRLSATDWVEGGWDLPQSIAFAQALKARGADFVDVSSGGISPLQQIPLGPGYQVPFAERIRAESALPVMAVGLITTAAQAEGIVASGKADLVALARAMLYDPRWPWHAAAELGAQVEAPPQYLRAQPRELKQLFVAGPSGA